MSELSPAAKAVMIAATNGNANVVNDPVYRQCIAAALRAAAFEIDWELGDPKLLLENTAAELENHQ